MQNETFRKMRTTEDDMKGNICPQLSIGKEDLVSCLGGICASFVVTAAHEEKTVIVIADPEKADGVEAEDKLVLKGDLWD